MKKKKSARKTIIILSVLAALIILSSVVTYIKNITLPAKIKEVVVNNLQKETGKRTSIDSVYLVPLKGVVIKGLKIYDEKETMLEAGEISFNYLPLPLFRKKIIIPSLRINDLDVTIKNYPETEEWNFSSLNYLKKPRTKRLSKEYPLVIYKILLNNGNLHFTDNLRSPVFSKNIKKTSANLTLTPAQIKFTLGGIIEQRPKDSQLVARGSYKYTTKTLKLAVEAQDLAIYELASYYSNPILARMHILTNLKGDMVLDAGKTLKGKLKASIDKNVEFDLSFVDTLDDAIEPEFSSDVTLTNFAAKIPPLPEEVKNIDGVLKIKNNLITAEGLKLNLMGIDCELNGNLKDFQNPAIDMRLKSKDLSMLGVFNIVDENGRIEKAEISYKGSSASFIGDIYDIRDPNLNIYGDMNLLLEDISPFLSDKWQSLKDVGIKGRCSAELFIGGRPSVPRLLEMGLKLKSDKVRVGDLSAENLNVKIISKDERVDVSKFDMDLYGGIMQISSILDLRKEKIPYEIAAHLRGVRIGELVQETKLKGSGIYGDLNGSLNLSGIGDDLGTIRGEGWLHIKDAHLGPLPVFIPVVTNLVDFFHRVLPGYEKIMLKEATATFTIADEKIVTHDFILWGNEASVLYDGSIDFKGNLDFRVENNFVEGLVDEKTDMGRSLSTFITGMGSFISEARLVGTIKNPQYKFKPLPFKKLFQKQFKDLFKGILR